ncbi:glucose-6-phosphate isomerase [Candidatus Peregrinibacteria bacterium]|nr:glucose-6-phosphate isomerase [Candidatus Peregrinibacteria bacterium]
MKRKIPYYLKKIHARKQGFYNVIDDEKTISAIQKFARSVRGRFDDIVLLGIGGSALGPITIYQSLKHLFANELPANKRKHPRLHVLDNIDPGLIKDIEDIITYKRTLFIVASKSGKTPETISQYFYFRKKCDEKKLKSSNHFVFITEKGRGLIFDIGSKENIPLFYIPENVGGRFSVLTPVGLVPAALTGVNIAGLILGAKKMRENFLSRSFEKNIPYKIAVSQFLLYKKGINITVLYPYSQRLIKFTEWYKQLLAESIGKANIGITPVNALGVTDQHSQNQLYNEGPNDKFFIFIKVKDLGETIKIPNYIKNLSFNKLFHTEQEGTIQALTHYKRPNIIINIDKVDEENLGALFMLFEASVAFLGELFKINAFNQPGVELSKKITQKLLE